MLHINTDKIQTFDGVTVSQVTEHPPTQLVLVYLTVGERKLYLQQDSRQDWGDLLSARIFCNFKHLQAEAERQGWVVSVRQCPRSKPRVEAAIALIDEGGTVTQALVPVGNDVYIHPSSVTSPERPGEALELYWCSW